LSHTKRSFEYAEQGGTLKNWRPWPFKQVTSLDKDVLNDALGYFLGDALDCVLDCVLDYVFLMGAF